MGEIVGRAPKSVVLALKVVFVGIICFLSTEIGFAHKVPPHNISVLWPTNAILFAVLVVTPVRDWWAYAVAAYFTSIVRDAHAGFPISGILFLPAAFLEAFIAAAGVRRFADGVRAFESLRTLIAYVITAAILAPIASSFVAAFAGEVENYWYYWRIWFLPQALAYLTLAPAILTWIGATRTGSVKGFLPRIIEICLLGCGLFVVCIGVFVGRHRSRAASQRWCTCLSHSFCGRRCVSVRPASARLSCSSRFFRSPALSMGTGRLRQACQVEM